MAWLGAEALVSRASGGSLLSHLALLACAASRCRLLDHINWQVIFIVNALLAFASLVLAFVPKSVLPSAQGGIDWIGALLFALAVALVLNGLSQRLGRSWTISLVVILLGGLCLFAFWLTHELRHANPLIDVRQLGRREMGFANLAFAAISMGPLLGPVLLLPLLQQPVWTGMGFGVSATLARFIKLPAHGAATISALVCGALTRTINVRYAVPPVQARRTLELVAQRSHRTDWRSLHRETDQVGQMQRPRMLGLTI